MHSVWALLGIEHTKDLRAIKRAYAALLKIHHPEDDPEGFRRLNQAYQAAVEYAQAGTRVEIYMPPPPPPPQKQADFEPPPRSPPPPPAPKSPPLRPIEPDAGREVPQQPLPEPQAEEPRHDPATDARELIEVLRSHGDAAAVEKLEEILVRPVYRSIAAKEEFQKAVLLGLPWQGVLPAALLSALAERFGWHEPRHPFARTFPAQFQGIRRARDQHLARRMLEDFAAGKSKQYSWLRRQLYKRAARMLLGRTPRFIYRVLAADKFLREYASLIIKRIHQSYPLASEAVYDPAALAWCRSYLLAPTPQFKSVNQVLMALNFITGIPIAVTLEIVWPQRGRLLDYPNVDIALRLFTGYALVALPLYALQIYLIPVWDGYAKAHLTPKRRLMAFRLAALLLYALIILVPALPGLYLWGLAVALFALRMPKLVQLAITLSAGGVAWAVMNAGLGPHGVQYYGQAHGALRLDDPFVGWLFVIALIPLHRKLAARRWWWTSFRGYLALAVVIMFAFSFGAATLINAFSR